MKEQINITIKDIDNLQSVLVALNNLFQKLVYYYAQKEDLTLLTTLILSCSVYFGQILKMFGYNEDDFKQEL